jgi:hypothetical protein
MTTLYAKGYDKTDEDTTMYLWGLGDYKYEIERIIAGPHYTVSEVFEASFEEAIKKFEDMIDLERSIGVLM